MCPSDPDLPILWPGSSLQGMGGCGVGPSPRDAKPGAASTYPPTHPPHPSPTPGPPYEHVVRKQGVVGPRADDADAVPHLRMPAGVAVSHVQSFQLIQEVHGALAVQGEGAARQKVGCRPV